MTAGSAGAARAGQGAGWPRLARRLAERGSRALVVVADSSREPDLAPFVGDAHLSRCFVIAAAGEAGPPHLGFLTAMERQEAAATGCRLLTPAALGLAGLAERDLSPGELWGELLRRALECAGVVSGEIALAGRLSAGALLEAAAILTAAGWPPVDGGALVRRLRKRKRAAELAEARRVAAATVGAFAAVAGLLVAARERHGELWLEGARLTAGRLRAEIAAELARHELEQPEGNILAAAGESGVPHTRGASERVLRAGESLVVDLFPRGRLFADCTRTFCVGEPAPALLAAHAEVLAALTAAHRSAIAGADGWSLQAEICDRFEAAGHATPRSHPEAERGYVHGLGHGVGYELHELPSFRRAAPEAERRLEAGDLFTLEPGLYDPGAGWGVRLEDLCCLGPDGPENLTPAPYHLDPRAWGG